MSQENDSRLRNPSSDRPDNQERYFKGLSPEAEDVIDKAIALTKRENCQFIDTRFFALALLECPEIREAFADNIDLSKFEEELATQPLLTPTVTPSPQPLSRLQKIFGFKGKTKPAVEPTQWEMGVTPTLAHILRDIPKYKRENRLLEVEAADLAILLATAHTGCLVSFIREQKVDKGALIASLKSVRRTEKDRVKERLAGFSGNPDSSHL